MGKASCAFLLLLLLLAGAAARLVPTPTTTATATMMTTSVTAPPNGARQHPHKTGFRHRGHIFSYLPRDSTVPPSGPSPRHDSEVASTPGN
ncbi:hypothetical protein BT93_D1897 [Corymbia citriodora subsp. variegata]|nr:hypothetical protein BT93_D1897 [Corymbia citriodora subsp. variegata]